MWLTFSARIYGKLWCKMISRNRATIWEILRRIFETSMVRTRGMRKKSVFCHTGFAIWPTFWAQIYDKLRCKMISRNRATIWEILRGSCETSMVRTRGVRKKSAFYHTGFAIWPTFWAQIYDKLGWILIRRIRATIWELLRTIYEMSILRTRGVRKKSAFCHTGFAI